MPANLTRTAAVITLTILLSSCASGYYKRVETAHNAYFRGDYDKAISIMDKLTPAPRDRLLYLLDMGMILHGAERYEESNKFLTEAEDLSDALTAKSITREIGATLGSEEATEYAGEKYERVMIPVIRMLNYIMMDDWDEALIEVRRVQYLVEKTYGRTADFDNAFATYLSAIVWEALGHINDALIDYRHLQTQEKDLPYYAVDIKQTSGRLGIPTKLPPRESAAWNTSPDYRDRKNGELVLIVEAGRSPQFISELVSTGLFSIAMPVVVGWPNFPPYSSVSIDGKEAGQTYPFYNIADDIMIALKDRRKRSFVRKMIKVSLQAAMYGVADKMMDSDDEREQIAGIAIGLMSLFMSAAEKADERSWRTLPAAFQLGRFYLPPGTHEVEITPSGEGTSVTKTVEIEKEKPEVLLVRFSRGIGEAKRIRGKEPADAAKSAEEIRALSEAVQKNPKNGDLKIDLAMARVKTGDYDVEVLLNDGLEQGGNKEKGSKALVIIYTVKGQFDSARRHVEDADFKFAGEVTAYLTDDTAPEPSWDHINLTKERDISNGFNYCLIGLILEKKGDHAQATTMFADAYEYGLTGGLVAKKVMESFKKTDDAFKKSERGVEIISKFADSYLPHMGQ